MLFLMQMELSDRLYRLWVDCIRLLWRLPRNQINYFMFQKARKFLSIIILVRMTDIKRSLFTRPTMAYGKIIMGKR